VRQTMEERWWIQRTAGGIARDMLRQARYRRFAARSSATRRVSRMPNSGVSRKTRSTWCLITDAAASWCTIPGRGGGADYSKWNDVHLTLDGRYGVRSTQLIHDSRSAVMHVAAPVLCNDKLVACSPSPSHAERAALNRPQPSTHRARGWW